MRLVTISRRAFSAVAPLEFPAIQLCAWPFQKGHQIMFFLKFRQALGLQPTGTSCALLPLLLEWCCFESFCGLLNVLLLYCVLILLCSVPLREYIKNGIYGIFFKGTKTIES